MRYKNHLFDSLLEVFGRVQVVNLYKCHFITGDMSF